MAITQIYQKRQLVRSYWKIWHSFIVKIKHDEITFYKKKSGTDNFVDFNGKCTDCCCGVFRSCLWPPAWQRCSPSQRSDLKWFLCKIPRLPSSNRFLLLFTNFALGGAILIEFSRVVENQIHEGVKATEDPLHLTAAVDPQADLLVHELLQLWWVSLGHLGILSR